MVFLMVLKHVSERLSPDGHFVDKSPELSWGWGRVPAIGHGGGLGLVRMVSAVRNGDG